MMSRDCERGRFDSARYAVFGDDEFDGFGRRVPLQKVAAVFKPVKCAATFASPLRPALDPLPVEWFSGPTLRRAA
jgi:hypothetical protein